MKTKEFDLLVEILKNKKMDSAAVKVRIGSVIKADSLDFVTKKAVTTIHHPNEPALSKSESDPMLENHIQQNHASNQKFPRIEVIRNDHQIEYLLVYCRCGETIKIEFDNP